MRWVAVVSALAAGACSGGGEQAPAGDTKTKATVEPAAAAITVEPMGAVVAFAAASKGQPASLELEVEHLTPLHADCAAGSEVACVVFIMTFASALDHARAAGPGAIAALAKGCDAGAQMRCLVAAEALDDPGGTSRETPAAIAQLKKLCDGGLEIACARAGAIRIASGLDVPSLTEAEARAFIARGCAKQILVACAMEVVLAGAIPPPHEFAGSEQYRTRVRACDVGDISACMEIFELLRPAPPFGCSQCDAEAVANGNYMNKATGSHDERCLDCYIVQCRREHCCPTCPDRNTYACCADEGGEPTVHPEVAPAPDPARWKAAASAARAGTGRGLALWKAGCARDVPGWCELTAKLEASLASLDRPQQP